MRRRHASIGSFLLVVTLMTSMLTPAGAQREPLVSLCHTDPSTGNVAYLEVPEAESSVHLEHGDVVAPNGPDDCVTSQEPVGEESLPTEEPSREETRPTEIPADGEVAPVPFAQDDEYTAEIGVPLVVAAPGVLTNDGGATSAVLVREPSWGSLDFGRDGSFTYIADRDHPGTDVFAYQSVYDEGGIDIGQVYIFIPPDLNEPPVALDDYYALQGAPPFVVTAPGVLANDSDPDGDPIFVDGIGSGWKGMYPISSNSDGGFTLIPHSGGTGHLVLSAVVSDGVEFVISNLTIDYQLDPNTPVAGYDTYIVPASGTITVDAANGLLANDSSPAGIGLSASLYFMAPGATFTINPDGSFTFTYVGTPQPNSTMHAWYQVTDSQGRAILQVAQFTFQ